MKKQPTKKLRGPTYTIDEDGVERRSGKRTGRVHDMSTRAKINAVVAALHASGAAEVRVRHRQPLVVTLPPISETQLAAMLAPLGWETGNVEGVPHDLVVLRRKPWAGPA